MSYRIGWDGMSRLRRGGGQSGAMTNVCLVESLAEEDRLQDRSLLTGLSEWMN